MSYFDDDVGTSSPNWRENLRSEIVAEIAEESNDDEVSDDFDLPLSALSRKLSVLLISWRSFLIGRVTRNCVKLLHVLKMS